MSHTTRQRCAALVLIPALVAGWLASAPTIASASAPAAPSATATTTAREAQRVDSVATPKLHWKESDRGDGYSASVWLPLDYDRPKGQQVKIALFKVPAADKSHRIGTLFLNPGGPGGSGVSIAKAATTFLSQDVLDRFDVIGFDPRGTNASTQVRCFSGSRAQSAALAGLADSFPSTRAAERRQLAASKKLAKACSAHGRKLATAMSTAEVARDLDVLRRAVGDRTLTYLGFSYGTYLGEVYAKLFPDRVRALVLDGVVDPNAWTGVTGGKSLPTSLRIRSAEGASKALRQGLQDCADAGPTYCPLANPLTDFDRVAAQLRQLGEVNLTDDSGTLSYDYPSFISDVLGLLYYPGGMDYVAQLTAQLDQAIATEGASTLRRSAGAATLVRSLHRAVNDRQKVLAEDYDNNLEAYSGVICTDGRQPTKGRSWTRSIHALEVKVPYFASAWGWSDAQCATRYWRAADEDVYRGGFATNTVPVMVVGNYFDPATNYDSAVNTAKLFTSSYLVSSDSWGHTAFGTSDCVTDRVEAYLLKLSAPADGLCTGDVQPFTTPLSELSGSQTSSATLARMVARTGLAPISQPWIGK